MAIPQNGECELNMAFRIPQMWKAVLPINLAPIYLSKNMILKWQLLSSVSEHQILKI